VQTRPAATILAGRYALEEQLGRSGTGLVWRGVDLLLGRTVAVKLVHPRLADDPAFAAQLELEVRRLASLSCPMVARLLDTGQEDGVRFLVREYLDGTSAKSVLEASGPLAPHEAVRIATEVLDALASVHEAGLLHLNLELDDVLLCSDGVVRVTDLGIGAAVTAAFEPDSAARPLGGDGLAPEQRAGGRPDARTDVFAVGALLFALLTGEAPADRRSPSAVRPDLPRSLDRAVARALEEDPDRRFDGAAPFASALREIGPSVSPADPGSRHGGWGAWLGVPLAIAIVAAATILAGLWLGRLEVGGPLGIRPAHDDRPATASGPPSPSAATVATPLRPVSVEILDPAPGDGAENDSTAPLSIDGDPATAWRSENYFDGRMNKDGVGLLFDLGDPREVVGFRMSTPAPGFAFRIAVGDDPATLLQGLGATYTSAPETTGSLAAAGRYVLVWITTVVPVSDGNRAEVSEFEVVTTADA
jgi:serine/threonine-protein kinase